MMNHVQTHSMQLGDRTLTFETGRLAGQAQGAVLVTYGEQVILNTAGVGGARPGLDFFPLVVEFEPKFYAAGKLKHSKINKREGRKSDRDILTCRVTDRPLRPMFPKGMRNEVQIINTLLQADGETTSAPLCITGASLAIQMAGLPFEAPVSGVHVGMDEDGNFMLSPTFEQAEANGLDLIVAGTEDSIMMVEAGADLMEDEKMIEALKFAHEAIKDLCQAQKDFLAKLDITEYTEVEIAADTDDYQAAVEAVDSILTEDDFSTIRGETKKEFKPRMKAVQDKVLEACADRIEEGELDKSDLLTIIEKRFAANMREEVFTKGTRVDGRAVDKVRDITVETGLFPRIHGSGLFQRGETQVLSMLTLGGPDQALHISDADRPEYNERYMHHYNFPPYSVGETRPLRGPGRREIGHGALAERALKYVIPGDEQGWAYTMRVVSEVLACNGSSSMGSVCGSTLALLDAGVPIKAPIAGIAMGLLMKDSGDYKILTDIQGLEDFDGDMDFKVAGTEEAITCLQLDIKIKGLDLNLLVEALKQAKVGRTHILSEMKKVISEPNPEMNPYAPLIDSFKVDPDFIGAIIGKGGEVIQAMTADYEVDINIEDDGTISITGKKDNIAQAREHIDAITYTPEIGDIFENCAVKTIKDFGAFVEFAPGKDALLHISEIADERVEKVEDYLSEGQRVTVKITEIDKLGRIKLSMKGLN